MWAALAQAKLGAERGEVPVGAVVAVNGRILAAAHNAVEATPIQGELSSNHCLNVGFSAEADPTAHAEIRVLRRVWSDGLLSMFALVVDPAQFFVSGLRPALTGKRQRRLAGAAPAGGRSPALRCVSHSNHAPCADASCPLFPCLSHFARTISPLPATHLLRQVCGCGAARARRAGGVWRTKPRSWRCRLVGRPLGCH